MKIDNIKFNDNTVDSLSFNGQEVTKLVMPNGDYWEKGSSSEPVLKLAVVGAETYNKADSPYEFDTIGGEVVVVNDFKTVRLLEETNYTIAIPIIENENTGGIVISPTYNSNRYFWTSLIDEHSLLIIDSSKYGAWAGDQGNEVASSHTYTFNAVNNSKLGSKVIINRRLNETPMLLIDNSTRNKAFRVAHTARTGSIPITNYPYYYYSKSYLCPMALLPIEKNVNNEW